MKKILIMMVLIGIMASATNALDLTSAEAEKMALSHSHQLKIARSESEAYRSNLSAARAGRYPEFSLEAKALYNSEISTLDITIPNFSIQRDIGQHEIYQADLKIIVPLYTGGKILSAINLAEANLEINEALLQKSTDEISFMAKQEFLKLYKSDKLLDAARSSLMRVELVKNDITALYNAGAADSVDLFEIELSYNNAAPRVGAITQQPPPSGNYFIHSAWA